MTHTRAPGRRLPPVTLAATLLALTLLPATGARAGVVRAAADHMTLEYRVTVAGAQPAAWNRLVRIASWWGSDHTYSGAARNLSLDPRPGGCWCERWADGQIEHARVLYAAPGAALRTQGAFGPLQAMAVTAVLDIRLAPGAQPGTTSLVARYVVNGTGASGLDAIAPVVDRVLGEQFARLGTPAAHAATTR